MKKLEALEVQNKIRKLRLQRDSLIALRGKNNPQVKFLDNEIKHLLHRLEHEPWD